MIDWKSVKEHVLASTDTTYRLCRYQDGSFVVIRPQAGVANKGHVTHWAIVSGPDSKAAGSIDSMDVLIELYQQSKALQATAAVDDDFSMVLHCWHKAVNKADQLDRAGQLERQTGSSTPPSKGLDLNTITKISLERVKHWHQRGGVNHWSAEKWLTALVGEVGSVASELKLYLRQNTGVNQQSKPFSQERLGEELADVQLYLVLLAERCGIDLETVVIDKFNKVSIQEGFPERLERE